LSTSYTNAVSPSILNVFLLPEYGEKKAEHISFFHTSTLYLFKKYLKEIGSNHKNMRLYRAAEDPKPSSETCLIASVSLEQRSNKLHVL